jgi:Protein of unknown function (DUF1572)
MSDTTLAENYLAEARGELATCLARIKHCLGQLDERQVWWRPQESMNSVGNLLLHLCGNLKQRFLSVIDGRPDDRDRPKEFSERGPVPKAELLRRLEAAVAGADAVLAGLTAARLLEGRRYRGLRGEIEGTVLAVVLGALLHLGGHAQEIVYVTRLRLGDAYRFHVEPPPQTPDEATVAADDVVFEQARFPPHAPAASHAETNPSTPQAAPAGGPAADAASATPEGSPLKDYLLDLEQEFQDQEEEGKL